MTGWTLVCGTLSGGFAIAGVWVGMWIGYQMGKRR